MATASSMIFRGLTLLGEKPWGGTLTSAEATGWLDVLNAMLDSWSQEKIMCYQVLQENFALTASTVTYTIGPSSTATLSTARPTEIIKAFTQDTQSYRSMINVVDYDTYHGLRLPNVGNTYPNLLYYDHTFPTANLFVYPAPIAGLTLYIDSLKQLQSFANISTVINLPPGYQRAIETNFAIEASPGFAPVSAELLKIARDSKAAIKGTNTRNVVMKLDAMVAGGFGGNILTGP